MGITVLGSAGMAVYRGAVSAALPAEMPAPVAETALGTLGGAVGGAAQLPDALGRALLDSARAAFVQGRHLAAGVSAVLAGTAAVLAVILLRTIPASREAMPEPDAADATLAVVKGATQ